MIHLKVQLLIMIMMVLGSLQLSLQLEAVQKKIRKGRNKLNPTMKMTKWKQAIRMNKMTVTMIMMQMKEMIMKELL